MKGEFPCVTKMQTFHDFFHDFCPNFLLKVCTQLFVCKREIIFKVTLNIEFSTSLKKNSEFFLQFFVKTFFTAFT